VNSSERSERVVKIMAFHFTRLRYFIYRNLFRENSLGALAECHGDLNLVAFHCHTNLLVISNALNGLGFSSACLIAGSSMDARIAMIAMTTSPLMQT
jgi:hypothetical protein